MSSSSATNAAGSLALATPSCRSTSRRAGDGQRDEEQHPDGRPGQIGLAVRLGHGRVLGSGACWSGRRADRTDGRKCEVGMQGAALLLRTLAGACAGVTPPDRDLQANLGASAGVARSGRAPGCGDELRVLRGRYSTQIDQ
jgi:hypothetical protein